MPISFDPLVEVAKQRDFKETSLSHMGQLVVNKTGSNSQSFTLQANEDLLWTKILWHKMYQDS